MMHRVKRCVKRVCLSHVTSGRRWEVFGSKHFRGNIFRHILWPSISPLLLMSVTGESNPIHRLLLWNEKLASFTASDQMHLSLSLSLSVLICKRLKGALSPGSSASFHAWFTLICLIGHKDLEMAHLSVENVLIFLWHCYVEVFDFSLPLSHSSFSFLHLHLFLPLPLPLSHPLSFFTHHLFFSFAAGILLWCNSLFECI